MFHVHQFNLSPESIEKTIEELGEIREEARESFIEKMRYMNSIIRKNNQEIVRKGGLSLTPEYEINGFQKAMYDESEKKRKKDRINSFWRIACPSFCFLGFIFLCTMIALHRNTKKE